MDSSIRKKYLPNLTDYLSCCSGIYQNIIKLLPPVYKTKDTFSWPVSKFARIEASIDSRSRYTDVITLTFKWKEESTWLTNLVAEVKVCHDMNIAEVTGFLMNEEMIDFQNRNNSNNKLSYPIEKKQIHSLLFEWLSFHQ